MDDLIQTLQGINWNFSDYNSSKYPLDINSIPWYPATFIPPIPKFLIALLTMPGETVLDPFGGKGTTAVEAVKQGRFPIYNDLNPFASEITSAIFYAIHCCIEDAEFLSDEDVILAHFAVPESSLESFVLEHGINKDVFGWYDSKSLVELFTIINLMLSEQAKNEKLFYVRKLALSSILKPASSQLGHFTYVTDNCKPSKLIYKDAKKLYIDRVRQIVLAAQDLIKQFSLTNPNDTLTDILEKVRIITGDARKLNWINDMSINLVLTSPPYLCAQDYIKTMRLTNLFFPDKEGFEEISKHEIGPRSKRHSKANVVVSDFYSDMNLVFSEIQRVLVPGGYFCLSIGQGKARITESYDTVSDLSRYIKEIHGLVEIHHVKRKISSRVIQVGGVDKEDIIIFQKKK
jgi:DNA modification methylase